MADYIKRETAISIADTGYYGIHDILFALKTIPGLEIVHCRDCKYYQIDELKKDGTEDRRFKPSVCVLAEQRREPNHFCADGEKREES